MYKRGFVIVAFLFLCSCSFAQQERTVRLRLYRDGEQVILSPNLYVASMVLNGEEMLEGLYLDSLVIGGDVWIETYVKFREFEADESDTLIFTMRGPDFSVSTDISTMLSWEHFDERDQLITFCFKLYRSKSYYKRVNRKVVAARRRDNPVCKGCPGYRMLPNNPVRAVILSARVPLFESYIEEQWTDSLHGSRIYNSYKAKIIQSDIQEGPPAN